MIEFLPWYEPDSQFSRCSECGAVVITADQEQHSRWHKHNRRTLA